MTTDESQERCRVLEQGHRGIIGYLAPRAGYGVCVRQIPDLRLEPYLADLEDGGYAVDITAIPMGRVVTAVWNAPLLDLRLEDGETSPCPTPSTTLVAGLEHAFAVFASAKAANPAWTGLDAVGLGRYLAHWREAGARIGRMVAGTLVWEDAAPPEASS